MGTVVVVVRVGAVVTTSELGGVVAGCTVAVVLCGPNDNTGEVMGVAVCCPPSNTNTRTKPTITIPTNDTSPTMKGVPFWRLGRLRPRDSSDAPKSVAGSEPVTAEDGDLA